MSQTPFDTTQAVLTDNQGKQRTLTPNADGTYGYQMYTNNPGGSGGRDGLWVSYQYDPKTGQVTPTSANPIYDSSGWADYRPAAAMVGSVLAGGYLSGLGAGSTAADGTVSGMDLAADGGANAVGATANTAGQTALDGYDQAALHAAADGTGATGPTLAGINGASGVPALDLGTAAATATTGGTAKGALDTLVKAAPLISSVVAATKGGGGGSGSSTAPASSASPSTAGFLGRPVSQYVYNGFDPSGGTANRPPSSAINMNDPSASFFGYGTKPIYYAPPSQTATAQPVPQTAQSKAEGGPVSSWPTLAPDATTAYMDSGTDSVPQDPNGLPPSFYQGNTSSDYALGPNAGPQPTTGERVQSNLSDFWTRYLNGDPKAQKQMLLAINGVGALSSLIHGQRSPATAAQLAGTLKQNGSPTGSELNNIQAYFSKPASRYVPPPTVKVGGGGLDTLAVRAGSPTTQAFSGQVAPGQGVAQVGGTPLSSAGAYADGGAFQPGKHGPHVSSPGGGDKGQDDTVPAWLSHGEYVMDADTVSALGDGNNAAGAKQLDQMREAIRSHKRSAPPSKIPPKAKSPLQYLAKGNK